MPWVLTALTQRQREKGTSARPVWQIVWRVEVEGEYLVLAVDKCVDYIAHADVTVAIHVWR